MITYFLLLIFLLFLAFFFCVVSGVTLSWPPPDQKLPYRMILSFIKIKSHPFKKFL